MYFVTPLQQQHTTTNKTTEETPAVDNHLMHIWEARRSLAKTWTKQKLNRKLRVRISELTEKVAEYTVQLSEANWVEKCNSAARQMDSKGTWRFFHSLIDPTQTRGDTQRQPRKALHGYQGTTAQLADTLFCRMEDPNGPQYRHEGKQNSVLDAPFTLQDLRAALAKMRRGTAAGRDHITVKLLSNLPDSAYLQLLEYINQTWDGRPLPSESVILALDLKGAFDNVQHSSILANLSKTDCGQKTFAYIKDILSKRQAFIRIEDYEFGAYNTGTRGTPQGAVLSPLLFNIAMMQLPHQLARVEGIQHALYADDITIWTTEGSLGEIEDRLQRAANIVESYANCGLQCAPAKSELLHIKANPKDKTKLYVSLSDGPIREVEEVSILGLTIHNKLSPGTTISKLKRIGEQVGRMIHHVSNKRGGLRGKDALRLAHVFKLVEFSFPFPTFELPNNTRIVLMPSLERP